MSGVGKGTYVGVSSTKAFILGKACLFSVIVFIAETSAFSRGWWGCPSPKKSHCSSGRVSWLSRVVIIMGLY